MESSGHVDQPTGAGQTCCRILVTLPTWFIVPTGVEVSEERAMRDKLAGLEVTVAAAHHMLERDGAIEVELVTAE